MKLSAIYRFFVQQGIASDLRTRSQINKKLLEAKSTYQKLSKRERMFFDKDNLTNPYSDTRILFGDLNREVRRIMIGIDIEAAEILLADRISQTGTPIDLVLAHHPEGKALAALDDVMGLQIDHLHQLGLPYEIAKKFMEQRITEVNRRLHGGNHMRAVDAARLLNIPFMCCHTPSDNLVAGYLQKKIDKVKPNNLQGIVNLLFKEPEYRDAVINKAGPKILIGKPEDKAGKIVVDMTGGTEGSKEVFGRLSQSGVTTLLGMHLSEEHYNRIKAEHINVVIAGHIASDNLGINLLLDKLEKKDQFKLIECSGFRRIRRG